MASSVAARKAQKVDHILAQLSQHTPKLYEELCEGGQLYVVRREVEKLLDSHERNGLFCTIEEASAHPPKSCVGGGSTQTGKTNFPAVSS